MASLLVGVMASKLDKISRLAAGLADLPAPEAAPFLQDPAPRGRGRPAKEDMVSVNLRLPAELRERIVLEAARRSAAVRRTVTTQAVIVDVMDRAMPPLPDDDAPTKGGRHG